MLKSSTLHFSGENARFFVANILSLFVGVFVCLLVFVRFFSSQGPSGESNNAPTGLSPPFVCSVALIASLLSYRIAF